MQSYVALIHVLSQVPSSGEPTHPIYNPPSVWPQPPVHIGGGPVFPPYEPPKPPQFPGGIWPKPPDYPTRPPDYPVDPGYGQGQVPPSIWPKPPSQPPFVPTNPIVLPPGSTVPEHPGIWPAPGVPTNPIVLPPDKWAVLVFVPGVGYKWIIVGDNPNPPVAEPK